ncbi:MAG TPA: monofunctional biosynthetic peptidoglycan transglycosylase [Bryobacteraceae bacterium]|nr:monofunctional biosynthetic peptidoglycan transglycosylase [Bryobacteraceae bacterium]
MAKARVLNKTRKGTGVSGSRGRLAVLARRIVLALLAGVVAGYLFCCLALVALKWMHPWTTSVQMERRVEAMWHHQPYHKRYEPVPLAEISVNLQHAVIAAEDGRFYQHHGIDWQAVDEVVQKDLEEGKIGRGGSTITQQLVKNLFATTQRSWLRKIFEFTLAPVAEVILGKQRILDLYLNVIEWGPGIYGAEAAAETYFHTTASRLTREQCAHLAAIIPNPRRRKVTRMNDYSADILVRMRQMGW